MKKYRYRVVDVFTERALEGNPLAVFMDAQDLDHATMQKIARELNLSETTFIGPATLKDCAANVRIFTPSRELTFAGHPTVGTAYVLLEENLVAGNREQFYLQEKVGPIAVRVEAGERPLIWLTTPTISFGPVFDRSVCARAVGLTTDNLLNVEPQLVSAANPTVFVALRDKESVDRASVDTGAMALLRQNLTEPICLFVFTPTPGGAYSRMFAPEFGIIEDPATGSSTGPLAAFMLKHGLVPGAAGSRFVSEQGTKMGRRSILHVALRGESGVDGIDVGGYVSPVVEAMMTLD